MEDININEVFKIFGVKQKKVPETIVEELQQLAEEIKTTLEKVFGKK